MGSSTDYANQLFEQGYDCKERGEFCLAYDFYLQAAKLGDVTAQVSLANMLDDGPGNIIDPVQAVYWYKKAVKNGNEYGAYNLGIHYKNLGKKRWALYWLKRAAFMGYELESEDIADLIINEP